MSLGASTRIQMAVIINIIMMGILRQVLCVHLETRLHNH